MQKARRSVSDPALGSGRIVSLDELRAPFALQEPANPNHTATIKHGVALEGAEYKHIKGGSISTKPNSAHKTFSDQSVLALYGTIDVEHEAEGQVSNEVFYLGRGDNIVFHRNGTEERGLVLGFSRTRGHPYQLRILEEGQEDSSTVNLTDFVRMSEAELRIDEEGANQAIEKYLKSKSTQTEDNGT